MSLLACLAPLYRAFNPFIQMLKPISPLAWMPLLLYTVKNPTWTAILVVFLACAVAHGGEHGLWVSTIRKDYLQVGKPAATVVVRSD